jgi:hypothetical protein
VAAILLWAALAWLGTGQQTVRFHHVHYRVGDPSAAMSHVAAKVNGPRVMLPGLGVGVRVENEFLLFDRLEDADPAQVAQPRPADGYRVAVAWLARHGVTATPGDLATSSVIAGLVDERYDHMAFVTGDLGQVREQLARSGATPVRSSEDSVLFEAGAGVLVEIVRESGRPDAFWCPMHPDVRSPDGGTCHLCGMEMVAIPPPKLGEYKLDVRQLRRSKAGLSGLKLAISDPESGELVKRFVTVHERVLHLFIVGKDLEYFEHVHPDVAPDGSFILTHAIPPGEYMVIADFLPEGGTTQMVQRALIVPGATPSPKETVSPGLRVALKAEDFVAGKYACLTFTVTDANTGAPVTDLEPFLGAPAHMLIVRADLTEAIHVHPEERATGGPTISFHPLVPAAGEYKAWIQVQRGGKVTTVPVVLRAER